LLDLYEEKPQAALYGVDQHWTRHESSQLLGIEQIRGELLHLRGRCRLAAGGRRGLAQALRDARALESEQSPWIGALGALLRAGCTAAGGDAAGATRLLRTAVERLDAADLCLYAAAARLRLGQLLGGDEGRALLTAGEAYMAS